MRTNEQLKKAGDLCKIWGWANCTDYYCKKNGNSIAIWDFPDSTKAIIIRPNGSTTKDYTPDEWKVISAHLQKRTEQMRQTIPATI